MTDGQPNFAEASLDNRPQPAPELFGLAEACLDSRPKPEPDDKSTPTPPALLRKRQAAGTEARATSRPSKKPNTSLTSPAPAPTAPPVPQPDPTPTFSPLGPMANTAPPPAPRAISADESAAMLDVLNRTMTAEGLPPIAPTPEHMAQINRIICEIDRIMNPFTEDEITELLERAMDCATVGTDLERLLLAREAFELLDVLSRDEAASVLQERDHPSHPSHPGNLQHGMETMRRELRMFEILRAFL